MEQLNYGMSIQKKLDECASKETIELCKPDNIMKLNSKRLSVYSFGSWNTQELSYNNKGKILASLKEPEKESAEPAFLQLKQKGFVNLEEATFRACEITPWAKDAPCQIDRAGLSTILAKDVANLNTSDLETMLAI